MLRSPSISVVIPTVGRPSLNAAVESALRQTLAPHEVIVVLDVEGELRLPQSPRIRVVRTSGGGSAGGARHLGVTEATGEVIALLDDDDTWSSDKLERQLAAVPSHGDWVLSCRFVAQRPGKSPILFPRKLYESGAVAPYLFDFHSLRRGRATLQTSTLVFPRALAERVPLSITVGMIHDEPTWLMELQRVVPDLRIVQLPEPLVEYGLTANSLSRSAVDRTTEYIDWGLRLLAEAPKRTQGDYQLTNPVSSALAADSPRGVARSIRAAIRTGRPSLWAWSYAVSAIARIYLRRARRALHR